MAAVQREYGLALLLIIALFFVSLQPTIAERKPNILIFLVDDLGVADLACFGNDSLATPNIDKLASEGARLTHDLAGESVCTPSRAAFLTGRYPVRTGMIPSPGGISQYLRVMVFTATSGGLPRNETTFAKVLAESGYATGLIGKWHLGLNLESADDFYYHPIRHGFQSYYGLPLTNLRNCEAGHSVIEHIFPKWKIIAASVMMLLAFCSLTCYFARKISSCTLFIILILPLVVILPLLALDNGFQSINCFLMRDYQIVEQPVILKNLTSRFTAESIGFIEKNKYNPFMLMVSYAKVHTALFTTREFEGHSGHSRYGDNVEEMDWSVGKIMEALEDLGLKDDTFVYFTSDNGPHLEEVSKYGEYEGGWKGRFRGGKGQAWEGGIRVPTIVSWPSHIKPGIDINEPTNGIDLFPTVLHVAGVSQPTDRIIDGRNLIPLLTQEEQYSPHEFMYHYCSKAIHAVRYRPRTGKTVWKAHFMTPIYTKGTEACFGYAVCGCYGRQVTTHDPPLLFDVTADPTESNPISPSDSSYKPVMAKILADMRSHTQTVDSVPFQLDKWWWKPWLQSCCNFPSCHCVEDTPKTVHVSDEL